MARNEPAVQTADDLIRAVRRLDMALAEWHSELSGRMEMGTPELMALAHLSMADTLGPSELARRLRITTGAMTALLDRLAEHGHVLREPHPSDRRRVVVRLTPHARAEASGQVRPMSDETRGLAERLSPDERRIVGSFLEELTAIVSRSARQPQPSSKEAR